MRFPSHFKDRDTYPQLPGSAPCTSHLYFLPPCCLSHRRSPSPVSGCPPACARTALGDGAGLWLDWTQLSLPSRRRGNFLRSEGLLPLRSDHTCWERRSVSRCILAPSRARPSLVLSCLMLPRGQPGTERANHAIGSQQPEGLTQWLPLPHVRLGSLESCVGKGSETWGESQQTPG